MQKPYPLVLTMNCSVAKSLIDCSILYDTTPSRALIAYFCCVCNLGPFFRSACNFKERSIPEPFYSTASQPSDVVSLLVLVMQYLPRINQFILNFLFIRPSLGCSPYFNSTSISFLIEIILAVYLVICLKFKLNAAYFISYNLDT